MHSYNANSDPSSQLQMAAGQQQGQGPVIIETAAAPPPYNGYGMTCVPAGSVRSTVFMKVTGILQIVLGALCIIFHITALSVYASMSIILHGIWCGILFIVTGGLGCGASCRNNTCMNATYMAMSILSAVFTSAIIICCSIGLSWDVWYNDDSWNYDAKLAMNSVLIVLAVAEAITAIVASGMVCNAQGCCNPGPSMVGHAYVNSAVMYQDQLSASSMPYVVQQRTNNVIEYPVQVIGPATTFVQPMQQQAYSQQQTAYSQQQPLEFGQQQQPAYSKQQQPAYGQQQPPEFGQQQQPLFVDQQGMIQPLQPQQMAAPQNAASGGQVQNPVYGAPPTYVDPVGKEE